MYELILSMEGTRSYQILYYDSFEEVESTIIRISATKRIRSIMVLNTVNKRHRWVMSDDTKNVF